MATSPSWLRAPQTNNHRSMAAYNRRRLALPLEGHPPCTEAEEHAHRQLEIQFVEAERRAVRERAAAAPRDPKHFVAWFEALKQSGPGQGHPLFPWLAEAASLEEMKYFLAQEVAGEAGFDDLVALTQLKMPAVAKLELARNYWDEMGQGHAGGMHGPMLERLAAETALHDVPDPIVDEALALGNLMLAFAMHRRYAYQSVGALGVIELTAPGRAECVNAGLKRLGLTGEARRYFALHATLDVKHSEAWNREVLTSLVERNPASAPLLAEGALLRLTAGERCFERYCRELGICSVLEARSAAARQ